MPITASDKGGEGFEPLPAGMHDAVCYGVYDIGSHYNQMFGNMQRKVIVLWEIPAERMEVEGVDKPKVTSNSYTLSLSEKANLRKHLESWRGVEFTAAELEGFDISKLIGVSCQLQLIHKKSKDGKKTYANIATIIPWHNDKPKLTAENDRQYFSLEDDIPIPGNCPEWIKKKIEESHERKQMHAEHDMKQEAPANNLEPEDFGEGDDIPF